MIYMLTNDTNSIFTIQYLADNCPSYLSFYKITKVSQVFATVLSNFESTPF